MRNFKNFFTLFIHSLLVLTSFNLCDVLQAKPQPVSEKRVAISISTTKSDSIVFRFEQTQAMGMATLFLNDKWLIIFDQPIKFEIPNFEPIFKSIFESFYVAEKNPKYTVAVIKFNPNIIPKIKKIEKDWCFELTSDALEEGSAPKKNTSITVKKGNKWPEITVHNAQTSNGLSIKYDEQDLFVIPTSNVDGGLQVFYQTPFYEVLNTIQGAAFLSLSSYTFFERTGNFYLIKVAKDIFLKRDVTLDDHIPTTFTLTTDMEKSLSEVRKIEDKILTKRSIDAHLKLALHYLSQGNSEKTLSILRAVISYAPAMEFHTTVQHLMCLAYLMKRDYAKTLEFSQSLGSSVEIEVWKQIASTHLNQTDTLFSMEKFIDGILKNYPSLLSQLLLPDILEMANNFGKLDLVKYLTQINISDTNDYFQFVRRFYEAELMRKSGEKNAALKLYTKIVDHRKLETLPITKYQAWAELQLILQQLSHKNSKPEQYLEKLKKLRLRWKGDYLEYLILKKIVEIYEKLKKQEEALKYMALIRDTTKSPIHKILIENKMRKILKAYFLERTNKPGKAVEVLSTYQTYQDMIADEDSSDIINLIMSSFLELDLLDQASDFLARSYAKMPDSIQKHKLQIEAARIYVLNKKYQAALTILSDMSEFLSPPIQQQKTLLKADALRYAGKLEESLALLRSSSDPIILRKAADILIEEKKWQEASKVLGVLVGLIDEAKTPNEKKQAIIDYAVILKSQDNIVELEILKKSYAKLMKEDSLFTMLTEPKSAAPKNREELEGMFDGLKKFSDLIKKVEK